MSEPDSPARLVPVKLARAERTPRKSRAELHAEKLGALVATVEAAASTEERRARAHELAELCSSTEVETLVVALTDGPVRLMTSLLQSADTPTAVYACVCIANLAYAEAGQKRLMNADAVTELMNVVTPDSVGKHGSRRPAKPSLPPGLPRSSSSSAVSNRTPSAASSLVRAATRVFAAPGPSRPSSGSSAADESAPAAEARADRAATLLAPALAALQNLTYANNRACRLVARQGGHALFGSLLSHAKDEVREFAAGILTNLQATTGVAADGSDTADGGAGAQAGRLLAGGGLRSLSPSWRKGSKQAMAAASARQQGDVQAILAAKAALLAATRLQAAWRGRLGRKHAYLIRKDREDKLNSLLKPSVFNSYAQRVMGRVTRFSVEHRIKRPTREAEKEAMASKAAKAALEAPLRRKWALGRLSRDAVPRAMPPPLPPAGSFRKPTRLAALPDAHSSPKTPPLRQQLALQPSAGSLRASKRENRTNG